MFLESFRLNILGKEGKLVGRKAQNILGNPENFIVCREHFGRER